MKKYFFVLVFLLLGLLIALPGLALADCVDIEGFTSFSITGNSTVTLYMMNKPFVSFDVQAWDLPDLQTPVCQ